MVDPDRKSTDGLVRGVILLLSGLVSVTVIWVVLKAIGIL